MKSMISTAICLALLPIGCSDSPQMQGVQEAKTAAIRWFEGDVEEAFASARTEGRPIFLYWGAEWCPPCHNLKKNVFTKPEFLDAIRDFVPVHLDGDTARAQLWAEKYGITGYPTVILFSPTGVELFRMPSDVTAEQYATLLHAAIREFRPVHQILAGVIGSSPLDLSEFDLKLLAYHSWLQDQRVEASNRDVLDAFWRIYSEQPGLSPRLRARFMALTLERAMPTVWSAEPDHGNEVLPTLDAQQTRSLRSGLKELLTTSDLWPDNKIFLTLQSRRAIETLEPEPSSGRDELVALWLAAAEKIQNHPEFSMTEQLMAFVPEFELHALETGGGKGSIPPSLREKVRARVGPVLSGASDPGEFQSTLNMLVWLHSMAGLDEEAVALLDRHMNQTAAPHYFLSILGDLGEDNPETALNWHRLAFERSGRGSSRVKWGAAYILKLVELAPADAAAIEGATRDVISELARADDAFAGRNHTYLDQLSASLLDWAASTGNEVVTDRLRKEMVEHCDRFGERMDRLQYDRCMEFLSTPTVGS